MKRIAMFHRLIPLVLVAAAACGAIPRESKAEKKTGTDYSASAQQNYEKGMKALQNEDWLEAAKFFGFIKARFPYSKFAALAELRIADAAFGLESYLEAIDQYRLFVKFHPTHEMVENGYVQFKIAEAYTHQLPDDWFISPPAFEKDQSSALDAARELSTVIHNYPKSPFVPKAKELHAKVAHLLAEHEWYVATFYWNRNKPMGTVLRLRTLLKKYDGAGFDQDALLLLGRAYERVGGHTDDAKKSYQTLIDLYPTSEQAADARRELARLGG
jgi:outer membrane protein assembly factor BamD